MITRIGIGRTGVGRIFLASLLQFLFRYRRTALGPLWLLIGPSLFIALLGLLYSEISSIEPRVFIPHLAVGLVLWTLFQSFVTGSATVFSTAVALRSCKAHRPQGRLSQPMS